MPHPIDTLVGRKLRLFRSLAGLSQERLGELLGVTFQQIQKYENGANRVGSSRLYEMSRVLNVPVQAFFDDSEVGEAPAQPAGLSEDRAAFVLDDPRLDREPIALADEAPVVDRRETLELVRTFNRISDPLVRRRYFELGKALAALRFREEG